VSVVRRAGIAAGALVGVAGATYAAQRAAAARVRRAADAGASDVLAPRAYEGRFLPTDDNGSLFVVETGARDAQPIVLSHGVALSLRTFTYQLDHLPREGFRAIAYDHRGHGRSVCGESGHSLANLASDIKTVVEGLDLRDAVLVGHSMGGVAVQSFVIRYPEIAAERVAGIVLLSSLAYTPFGSRSTRTKARLEKIMKRSPDGEWFWHQPNFGLLLARLGFGKHPHPSHVEFTRRMLAECRADTRRDGPRTLVGLDLTADLPYVEMPTLIIDGTADLLTPPFEAQRMAQLIPDARLELIPGGGHMLMLEETALIDRLIGDFAREVRDRARRTA
jgi:pimeloyl-ACP methyl ester carboxylesterase